MKYASSIFKKAPNTLSVMCLSGCFVQFYLLPAGVLVSVTFSAGFPPDLAAISQFDNYPASLS